MVRLVIAVAMCVACGCGASTGRVVEPAPTIVVVEPGAEPRQRLFYDVAPGLAEEIETTTKVTINNQFENTTLETGQRLADFPTNIIRARLEVTGRSPQGSALVSYTIETIRVLEDLIDPAMRRLAAATARELLHGRATWRLSPNGEVDHPKAELPDQPNADTQRLSDLADSFGDGFVRFPDVALGVGAIWQVESRATRSRVTWTRKVTYTLRELTDGQATVEYSVASRAESQALSVEPNATTKLTSGSGSFSGQVIVPRHGLVISGTFEGAGEINLLLVRQHLRIASTLRTQMSSSVKRLDATPTR